LPEPEELDPVTLDEDMEETEAEGMSPDLQQREKSFFRQSESPERRSLSTSKIFTTGDDSDDEIDLVENESTESGSQFQSFETPEETISTKVDASFFAPSMTLPGEVN
jgi:hypothetical protein